MVEICKAEGKIFKQLMPQYVVSSVHKRHYYMTECDRAFKLLRRIRSGEDVLKTEEERRKKRKKGYKRRIK